MKVTITLDNIDNLDMDEIIDKTKRFTIRRSGNELLKVIKENTPVDEGHLRSSWTSQIEEDQVTFTNSASYCRFVNEGTGIYGPHHQVIKRKSKLGREYTMNGQKGQHFVESSFRKVQALIPDIILDAVQRALQK